MKPHYSQHEPREKPVTRASHVSSARQGDWELSCEVCLKRTRNQVGTTFPPSIPDPTELSLGRWRSDNVLRFL